VNELFAYNISVVDEDVATFFGSTDLPQSTLDPIILNNIDAPPGLSSKSTRLFFRYLTATMTRFPPGAATESAVNDFAAFLLSLLDSDEPDRVVHHRLEIGFIMCGTRVNSKPDICVMDEQDFLLLVQVDKVSSYCLSIHTA
jgi:hypothetical protein